ncbi:VP2 [Guaico Culex virus]|nr:VP2 [Guaico Culex virus]
MNKLVLLCITVPVLLTLLINVQIWNSLMLFCASLADSDPQQSIPLLCKKSFTTWYPNYLLILRTTALGSLLVHLLALLLLVRPTIALTPLYQSLLIPYQRFIKRPIMWLLSKLRRNQYSSLLTHDLTSTTYPDSSHPSIPLVERTL